ncbi:PREDICTED: NF-kappa-B inhibitor delta [Elephantulus edwardii]|uniref:NF-kappa-B inhibitor delta n=1 Tax=Elephantulus edwardii TaxID=28737 RepID=UPI0003F0DADB|nr:PREDICTED: NF-kappa-B inhibitor delta [Elephantulus edwardii]
MEMERGMGAEGSSNPSSFKLKVAPPPAGPAHSESERLEKGLWAVPAQDWAGSESQFKNSRGPDYRSGTRRRLRGFTARLAHRRGRGPGAQQSTSRNPRGNRWKGSACRRGPHRRRPRPGTSRVVTVQGPQGRAGIPHTRGFRVRHAWLRAPPPARTPGDLKGNAQTEVSRNERSHCPSQTVKKLLEEQRRRQQQPDVGGASGQFLGALVQQPLTPSASDSDTGHSHFLVHQDTVNSGLGGLVPATGLPDWDPNTHAAYADGPYPASAAESFPISNFYSPLDTGQLCTFPQGMQGMEAESWRVSEVLPGPPQLPPIVQGPSLDTARAHMLALGPQQLLAQDEEGDTLLHLLAARGLRWAAYAAAEVLQACRHLDIREHKGKTPLLVAAAANQPLIVADLLNLGAEPNATDHQGRSVLHVAATYGLPGVLSAVFNSGVPVNLEARDFEGLTPLHTAILSLNVAMCPPDLCPRVLSTQARDRLTCVQLLLQMGADHASQEIKSNKTVLHLAVQAANPTLVQLLLEFPRGNLRAFVNMKAHGNTALHMAAALPPGPSQEVIVRRLLAAGADPTLRNLENEQPVHLLRPGPGLEGLRQLLKRSRVAPPPALSS